MLQVKRSTIFENVSKIAVYKMIVKRIHSKPMKTESFKINTPHVKTFADILLLYSLPVGVITQATDAPCQQRQSMYG